ncbi:DUF3995 domain-containing protein [Paenibacillus sp. S-38]|uniref:DUF3995 domain-containing protein n=1 Tax=Paenibacillus sp. S-38 TaxID=3416710 RepID=UPI003CF9DE1E
MQWILAGIVSGLLLGLSGVHAYWLFGGKKGLGAAVPSSETGPLFRPGPSAVALVTLLLALAAWAVLELGGIVKLLYPEGMLPGIGWLLSGVFLLRGVGDFRWTGVFKRKTGTVFAKWDTLLYSPLCFAIGSALLALMLIRHE